MNIFKQLLLVLTATGAAACGGGEDPKSDAKTASAKQLAESKTGEAKTVSAQEAETANQAVDVYAAHLTRVADALEAVESEADAQAAAQIIAEATNEFEILSEKFKETNKSKLAAVMAAQASKLTEPQMRIGMAMQKLATEHPEYLEAIGEAMEEMPPLQ